MSKGDDDRVDNGEIDEIVKQIRLARKDAKIAHDELKDLVNQILKERKEISNKKQRINENVKKFAYFASEQAGEQAGLPFDVWLMAERNVTLAVEEYLKLLSDVTAKAAGNSPRYEEISANIAAACSPASQLERLRDIAYFMWWSAGRQTGRLLDFWLQHDKRVDLMHEEFIISIADMITKTPAPLQFGGQDVAEDFMDSFSPAAYVERVSELAYTMWEYSGRQVGTTAFNFWGDAERHLSALASSTLDKADSSIGVAKDLAETLSQFSPRAHLDRIRIIAYQIWEAAGRPEGRALENWVKAEETVLGPEPVA